jgi:hypothetical protein
MRTWILISMALAGAISAAPVPAVAADGPWSLHAAVGAPDRLKLSGSVRGRYEWLEGQFRPGAIPDNEVLVFRTTLFAEYDAGPVRVGGELYDTRAYGALAGAPIGTGEVNAMEMVQAYVAADFAEPFGPDTSASAQLGRMKINFGSRRIVSSGDYPNVTTGYTGLRLDARAADGSTATLLYVMPQQRLPNDRPSILKNAVAIDRESTDLALWGAQVTKPALIGDVAFDALFLGLEERDGPARPTRNRSLRTVDARVIRNPAVGRFDFEVEAAYQFGSLRAGTLPADPELDISATFLHVDAGYTLDAPWRPRLSLEYDRASGDDAKSSYGRFDILYGMRRADFAPGGIYGALVRTNISTPGVRLEATPNARLDGFIGYRGLWAASATDSFATTGVRDPSGRSGTFAGQQVEGRVRYWIFPAALRLEVNAVVLFKAGLLLDAPNAPRTGNTRHVAVSLTQTF